MEVSNPLDLLSIKMCSPLVVYIVIVIIFGISLFMSRNTLKRFQTQRMDNLYSLYAWYEVKLLIIMGVVLYGLCQYNQVNLAWIFLLFPIIYLIIKNLFIFAFISLAHQNAPKEVVNVQQNYGVSPQQQQGMLQTTDQQQQQQQIHQLAQSAQTSIPVNKDLNMGGLSAPLNTMISPASAESFASF
jgi:hypothetical protein